ncbi:MAG: hypothetical protein GTO45_35250 [Candidatus Aminicenantes bacterium]|nr:hypothetical protein [Candidatus Aminicenantes bacterium]NIM83943.1 hypothetical protein [Candidatus Aminicenantes bacterium]NIN23412.1 hypothetical protein [Candidatus Aminicenantes bacterium]NIN47116.1 hypothetical protein [Candidatus Aminicenantes bacterium]NIN90040.1 hypothetical protein [Candidatus Aminicenantes bacterium]
MIYQQKHISLKIFCLIIIMTMGVILFPRVVANYTDGAYDNSGEKSLSIKTYIVESGGYILKGYSDIFLFLNKIEMSELNGTNYSELHEILVKAIENMTMAKKAYEQLITTAGTSAYNPDVINRLITFDYEGFQKEKGLIVDVFSKVKKYLEKGDVRGIYANLLADNEDILKKLSELEATVEAGNFPPVANLWRLNQQCSKTILFGQYASEVLNRILEGR